MGEREAVWLRAALDAAGISKSELGRRVGLTADQVSKAARGDRGLRVDEIEKIARETKFPLPLSLRNSVPSITYVNVVGEVAAGVWQDMTYADFDVFEIPIPVDPRWPEGAVSALVVRGESINRKAADGDFVVTLGVQHAPRPFQNGDWVIAERTRGDLRETTVKRVQMQPGGGVLLCPDSTDPKFTPLKLGDDGTDHVVVQAFVLDFVRPATRF